MAAKLIRQFDHLVVVGAPSSAAAAAEGVERAPAALRAAGLLDRLRAAGYQVTDGGDVPAGHFAPDLANPRAKNLPRILAVLEALRPRLEQAVKSRGVLVVLGGDATGVIALAAALRRQAAALGFVYLGSHAHFHTPADTEDGLVEPMVVSLLVGQGPAELVRFWNEPPLVREPDLALFGLDAVGASEREGLERSAIRRYSLAAIRKQGVRPAAEAALEGVRAGIREFIVHVELDAVAGDAPSASGAAAAGGLSLEDFAEALPAFLAPAKLAGLSLAGYNPALDPDGRGASKVVELIASGMAARLAAARSAGPAAVTSSAEALPPAESAAAPAGDPAPPAAVTSAESESGAT
ncbi:MAG TPA: arginase family protein [Candidatus Acidoferrales bacterium]|nr:arginase family protein [Candidatus Acidoferrales bacterium]